MLAFILIVSGAAFVLACGLFGYLVYIIDKEDAEFRAFMKERYE